jgi:hypothetical protein
MLEKEYLRPIVRALLEGWCIRENSYVHDTTNGGDYTITVDDAFIQAVDGNVEVGYFLAMCSHWSNDIQTFGEVEFGLMIESEGGEPYRYDKDVPGHKAGDIMEAGGKPLMKGGTLKVVECEPGMKAHAERHGYSLEEHDAALAAMAAPG